MAKTLSKRTAVKKSASSKSSSVLRKENTKNPLTRIRHYDFKVNEPVKLSKTKIKYDIVVKKRNAPSHVELLLEPKDGEDLVYHLSPGFTSKEPRLAQFSVLALITNKGTTSIDLDKVVIEYKVGNVTVKKEVFLPSDQLEIPSYYSYYWQNSRDYHEEGDIVFLQEPFPTSVKISFYFKDYADPITITKKIKPYNRSLALPFKLSDFDTNEYVTGYSMHGGGEQVFAYDLGVQAYVKDKWTELHPNKKGDKNEHYLVWGKPVYAMADGVVLRFENDVPSNTKLNDGSEANMEKQKEDYWGVFDYGHCGNHFYIRHDDVVAVYAHMQKGSLNTELMKAGTKVKKGDFLGKAGNSGNSTGPHLHIHIKTYKNDTKPEGGIFRPLLFNNGYVIGMDQYPTPQSNVNWSKLNAEGIPGLENKACFVHPSETHPYCAYPTNWGEVCRYGVPASIYQSEFDKVWTCGYYPIWVDGYEVLGKLYFNIVFRPSKGIQWIARTGMSGAEYQQEFDTNKKAGYRLININSYLSGGKIWYAAVWIKDKSMSWIAYHGWSLADHENKFQSYAKAGWVPVNVSCVDIKGKVYVTALWEKKNTDGFYLRPVMSLSDFVAAFDQYTKKEKYKLVYLDAFIKNGKPMLSGIWYKKAPNFNSWYEEHNQTSSQFQASYNDMLKNGYLTRCIAGYSQGTSARFEGVWSK